MTIVVPPAGIEPALPKELDFESSASTSSARGASVSVDDEARILGTAKAGSSGVAALSPFLLPKRRYEFSICAL